MKWRIIQSRKITKDIKDLCTQAVGAGRGNSVLGALRQVLKRLESNPLTVGEPHNRLKHFNLLLCVIVEPPLVIRFAIDEQRQWVYIRSVELLP